MPSGLPTLAQRALGGLDVELHLAAEEAVGAEPAEHQIGVGDGRLLAAEAVAGRPRLRAGALRADAQGAVLDARDRAAAGADLEDVHHGDLHRQRLVVAADQRRAGGQRLALVDHAGLGGGAAHVEGDGVLDAERVAERLGADHAGRRARSPACARIASAPARSRTGRRSIARSGTSRGSRPCGCGRRSRRRSGAPSARCRRWPPRSSSARTRGIPATARARPRRTCRDGACSRAPCARASCARVGVAVDEHDGGRFDAELVELVARARPGLPRRAASPPRRRRARAPSPRSAAPARSAACASGNTDCRRRAG